MGSITNKLQAQEAIQSAIRQIALKGIVNSETGAVVGTGKTVGFVAKIHDNPLDELFGTIDVQEYDKLSMDEENKMMLGYHEGVYISSIQDGSSGFVIIPLLYSDVVIDKDNDTGKEYVLMFSHVQHVQIDSHEDVTIGVKERQPFDPVNESAPDVPELPETGRQSITTYTADGVSTQVFLTPGVPASKQEMTGQGMDISVANGATKMTMDSGSAKIENGSSSTEVSSSAVESKVGGESVKVTSSGVEVGGGEMEEAVLGQKLAQLISQLLNLLSTAMTTTMMGPQPLIPAAQIAALQNQIKPFLSTHVKIQS